MPPDIASRHLIVTGDISIDWLAWPLPVERETGSGTANWRQREGTRMVARRGGALLLADLLREATRRPVVGPRVEHIETISADEHLHSLVDVEPRTDANGKTTGFRVRQLRGFCGPEGCDPRQPELNGPVDGADLVVLDDAGNGFRDTSSAWEPLLAGSRPRWLIVKMARPLAAGPMWEKARHGPRGNDGEPDPERLIVVLNADDLRAEGIALSRRLSWERTAEDFVGELGSNGRLDTLVTCAHLIVRFDCDGVIHHRGRSAEPPVLYFDPAHGEGEFAEAQGGRMVGTTAAFTAALAAALAADPEQDVDTGIRRGMTAARHLAAASFAADDKGAPDYPRAHVVTGEPDPAIVALPVPSQRIAEGHSWSILHHTLGDPAAAARRVVVEGPAAAAALVPVAQFGELRTADRREIESFRAIGNLLREYLSVPQKKPISIGVFGPPGAGKSFAVEQVVTHAAGRKLEMLEFNLSQFTVLADLIAAFHLVRDRALSGTLPLVFFDEFDCDFNGKLGWLRYFLAPMQDGTFREGGHAHPLGAAIVVFAGGTQPSFAKFAEPMSQPEDDRGHREFVDVKGPDFASRLRGHVDILGPDPVDENDRTYPIRRGFLLRSLIQRREKQLQSGDRLNVDDGVLNALLTVPRYRHGVRSMEALLAMSALTGRTQFERAALPPTDQLELHVDAAAFMARVQGERLADDLRERLGVLLHEAYREQRRKIAEEGTAAEREQLKTDPSMRDWEQLEDELPDSNRLQADDISRKLRAIGCFMAPPIAGREPVKTFSAGEIALLAELEHERFNAERLQRHWHLGERDIPRRTSPFLVPWRDLEPKWQSLDRAAAEAIPNALAEAGLRIYRVVGEDKKPR